MLLSSPYLSSRPPLSSFGRPSPIPLLPFEAQEACGLAGAAASICSLPSASLAYRDALEMHSGGVCSLSPLPWQRCIGDALRRRMLPSTPPLAEMHWITNDTNTINKTTKYNIIK